MAMFVFFDIGRTLLDSKQPQGPAALLADRLGLSSDHKKILRTVLFTRFIGSPGALADVLMTEFGIAQHDAIEASDYVWDQQKNESFAMPGGWDLLYILANARIDYGFISNIWHPYWESFESIYGNLVRGRLEVLSYTEGFEKPDICLYKAAGTIDGAAVPGTVMVGDDVRNDIIPAKSIGMKTVLVGSNHPAADMCVPDLRLLSVNALCDLARRR